VRHDNQTIPTLEGIKPVLSANRTKITSLFVEYTAKAEPLASPETLKRYLFMLFLIDQRRTFAFRGDKQYYRYVGPKEAEVIAPDTDPDYDMIPNGSRMKAAFEGNRKQTQQKAGKKLRGERMKLDPEMIVAYDGDKIRREYDGNNADIRAASKVQPGHTWFEYDFPRTIGLSMSMALPAANAYPNEFLPDCFEKGNYSVEPQLSPIDDVPCVVVEWLGHDRIWLDPSRGFAMRRRELFDPESGLLKEVLTSSEFVEDLPGLWLPRRFSKERCGQPRAPEGVRGVPLVRFVYNVTKLALNDTLDPFFTLQFPPGKVVMDLTQVKEAEKPVFYRMPADINDLDKAVRQGIDRQAQLEQIWLQQQSWFRRRWYIWGPAAALLGLATALITVVYFRSRRAGTSNP